MMHQNQGLPFPANQLIPPQVAGPQYQIQASMPQYQQLVQPTVAAVMDVLQRNASKNALRCFLFNQLTANNFQNQEFPKVINSVLELAVFHISTNQQYAQNPQAAVMGAAEAFCAMLASVNAKTFQTLYSFIDQATAGDVEQKAAEFMRLHQVLQQWKASSVAQPMGGMMPMQQVAPPIQNPWAGQQQQNVQLGGQPWNNWQQQQKPSTPVEMAGASFKPMAAQESFTAAGGQVQQLNLNNQQQQNFGAFANLAFSNVQPVEEAAPAQVEKPAVTFGFGKKGAQAVTVAATPGPVIAEQPVQEVVVVVEEPKMKDEFYIDGCPVRHVGNTDWTPSSTLENPYPTAYNPNTHTCFLQRHSDGTVEEVIVDNEDLTPEMEYSQHELKPSFKPQTKLDIDSGKVVIPNWSAVETLESKTNSEMLEVDGVQINPLIVQARIDAPNLDLAELHARVELANQGVASFHEDAIEFYYDENLVFGSDVKGMGELFEGILSAETAEEIQERFVKLKGVIPDRVWYALNQRATRTINEMTTINLQMKMSIDSFADDLVDLVQTVQVEKGKIFSVALEEGLRLLVKRVFGLKDVEYADGIPDGLYTYALSIGRSVTIVDWPSTSINVQIHRTGSCVKESYTPDLYKALAGILYRANEAGDIHEHLIVTSDNVVLKVDRGLIGRDNIVISFN